MDMLLRPNSNATQEVVITPPNGSRTVAGTGSPASQSQPTRQPIVFGGCSSSQFCSFCPCPCRTPSRLIPATNSSPGLRVAVKTESGGFSRSTTLTHGCPHLGQTPLADVAARMHLRGSAEGNTAKWLTGFPSGPGTLSVNGSGPIDQRFLQLRVAVS